MLKKRRIKILAGWLMIFIGIGIFGLPDYENRKENQREQARILAFQRENDPEDSLMYHTGERPEDSGNGATDIFKKTESLKRKIQQYNEDLVSGNQQEVFNAENITKAPAFLTEYQDKMFGYLEIPKIDCRMSLYLGSSDAHMDMGAAVLGGTSLPLGGENTNCVIAGHRGWKQRAYFKRIEELKTGDEIRVTNPWQCLHYQVAYTEIILPTDSEKLEIQDGKDMLTLLTCHPYRSGGKYRYAVYCLRMNAQQDVTGNLTDEERGQMIPKMEAAQVENVTGRTATSVGDIELEVFFRKAGKCIIAGLLGVLCVVQITHVFHRFARRRKDVYGRKKRRMLWIERRK
ncbi:class C sortase [uncultured Eubacterium sp.]|uniref:class C sortase n=1 Tax=uncultured Eubacterium sp. TaxID=165185 RepID=UPI0025D6F6B3|nr:class C sortase [uncultured Eubacterium sp.]